MNVSHFVRWGPAGEVLITESVTERCCLQSPPKTIPVQRYNKWKMASVYPPHVPFPVKPPPAGSWSFPKVKTHTNAHTFQHSSVTLTLHFFHTSKLWLPPMLHNDLPLPTRADVFPPSSRYAKLSYPAPRCGITHTSWQSDHWANSEK